MEIFLKDRINAALKQSLIYARYKDEKFLTPVIFTKVRSILEVSVPEDRMQPLYLGKHTAKSWNTTVEAMEQALLEMGAKFYKKAPQPRRKPIYPIYD